MPPGLPRSYGLDLFLLSIDEGISGYRDDSLETVKRNEETYQVSACAPRLRACGCQHRAAKQQLPRQQLLSPRAGRGQEGMCAGQGSALLRLPLDVAG